MKGRQAIAWSVVWKGFCPGATCDLLPVADLEIHFGAKGTTPRGMDGKTMSMCGANYPGVRRAATISQQPPSPTDRTVTVQQRIDVMKSAGVAEAWRVTGAS